MEQNTGIRVNWGQVNVPTVVGIVGLAVMLWNASARVEQQAGRTTALETYNSNLEKDRLRRRSETDGKIEALQARTAPLDNAIYRITVAETGIADVNRRIDRQGDVLQALRSEIGAMSSKIDVLSEQVRASLPKKAELDRLPSELR